MFRPNLRVPAPSCTSSHALGSLSRVHRAVAWIVCVVLTSFKLTQISCLTLWQSHMLSFHPSWLPWMWESNSHFSSLNPWVQVRSHSLAFSFSLPSFIPPSFADLYFPFQLSGTPARTQLVLCESLCIWNAFLMHLYSTSIYSSAVLSSPSVVF